MSVIELTRQLGAAIQQDERYKQYEEARKANEADVALNDLIGKINLLQLNYQRVFLLFVLHQQCLRADLHQTPEVL